MYVPTMSFIITPQLSQILISPFFVLRCPIYLYSSPISPTSLLPKFLLRMNADSPHHVGESSVPKNIPLYATHPRQLIIYNEESGEWELNAKEENMVKMRYMAVSYCQSDFPDKAKLRDVVENVCIQQNLSAYWLDILCAGQSQEEKDQDLYRIADVFRWASMTLIVVKGQNNARHSEGWLSWGSRKWTLPEALLSKRFICKIGTRIPVEMVLRDIANHAYRDDGDENMLISLYTTLGKDFLATSDRVGLLCKAIRSRSSGDDQSAINQAGQFTAYPAEWVYALMGLFLHRIEPTPDKSEREAFMELLAKNGLECNESDWKAFQRSNGKEKIHIRRKRSRISDYSS